ncbi:MAG: rhodanese-like domain-containing protein [Bacteriovoracaceae bacterium]|nr:rhodanese-like domain-containing protein [Bacteriovoracaceae bacterium]
MEWAAQNWQTIFLAIFLIMFVMRGPIVSLIFGVEQINVATLKLMLSSSQAPILIDVRTMPEFSKGHLDSAILVPLSEIKEQISDLFHKYKDREVALICRSGSRSSIAAVSLKRAGFKKVYNVKGGMIAWSMSRS